MSEGSTEQFGRKELMAEAMPVRFSVTSSLNWRSRPWSSVRPQRGAGRTVRCRLGWPGRRQQRLIALLLIWS